MRRTLVLTALFATLVTTVPLAGQGIDVTNPEELPKLSPPIRESHPFTEGVAVGSVGPDVTIAHLEGIDEYGPSSACPAGYSGDCRGFAVGTDSCNVGTVPVDWCDGTSGCRTTTDDYHPLAPATETDFSVIGQSLYRLKDGRFEQIGFSYLKHGFVSTNSDDDAWCESAAGSTCVGPPAGGDQLGVGCTDFYWASLNGGRPLGARSDVNPATGDHPRNEAGGETDDEYDQRIVVEQNHLDPAQNAGALYFAQGQYVVRDDSRSGPKKAPTDVPPGCAAGDVHEWLGTNGHNSASYRPVSVTGAGGSNVDLTGTTVRLLPAIHAWPAEDPEVLLVNVDKTTGFCGDPIDPPLTGTHDHNWVVERFVAAKKETAISGGFHYEIAIHNLNSDTSANSLTVDFGGPTTITNAGWSGRPHHSGEPYATTAWTIDVDNAAGTITWSTDEFGTDPNANALRWGQLFSFWFDTTADDGGATYTVGTFKDDGALEIPFESTSIFRDGFESGDVSAWSSSTP